MDKEIEQIRNGIFSLHTRRFGKVSELMIKEIYNLKDADSNFYDLYDPVNENRIEVKFGRGLEKHPSHLQSISTGNLLEAIEFESLTDRMFSSHSWKEHRFDINIQQIKGKEFNILYYGIFFSDKIIIFKLTPANLDTAIGYSDKQHKGNVGEGQFHLSQKSYQYHLDNYFEREYSYPELFKILQK